MTKLYKYFPTILTITFLVTSGIIISSFRDDIINYLGISNALKFNNIDYNLSWSSHPNENYYKHEYIPKDNTPRRYKDMLIVDFLKDTVSLHDAIAIQINNLNQRKQTDVTCNYQVLKKDGNDYILDFIMSDGEADAPNFIEWNAYHYINYTDSLGHKGMLLFGVSHRAYGYDVKKFMTDFKQYRNNALHELVGYPVPKIQIK